MNPLQIGIIMKKTAAIFALGFVSAYALPFTRAVIIGVNMGIEQGRRQHKIDMEAQSILDHSNLN